MVLKVGKPGPPAYLYLASVYFSYSKLGTSYTSGMEGRMKLFIPLFGRERGTLIANYTLMKWLKMLKIAVKDGSIRPIRMGRK